MSAPITSEGTYREHRIYQPGDRVLLIDSPDDSVRSCIGEIATVEDVGPGPHVLRIRFDHGLQAALRLHRGDAIQAVEYDAGRGTAGSLSWSDTMSVVDLRARVAGREAAEWWAQDNLEGRAAGDVAATAVRVLAGIDNGDPAILDLLPPPASAGAVDRPTVAEASPDTAAWWNEVRPADAPAWWALCGNERDAATVTYEQAYWDALTTEIARRCQTILDGSGGEQPGEPAARDSGRPRLGETAVFSDEWAFYREHGTDADRYRAGFVGRLDDWWNGWAVFSCTRAVAEAIVEEFSRARDTWRRALIAEGVTEEDAILTVDRALERLYFDGDELVSDHSGITGGPDLFRDCPNRDGMWQVMGAAWTWQVVDPNSCDRIVGDPPAEQRPSRIRAAHIPTLYFPASEGSPFEWLPGMAGSRLVLTLRPDAGHDDPWLARIIADPSAGIVRAWVTGDEGEAAFDAYVAGCCWHGRPLEDRDELVGLLLDEARVAAYVEWALAAGCLPVRLLSDDGSILGLYAPRAVASGLAAEGAAVRAVAAAHPALPRTWWEVWTAGQWSPARQSPPSPPQDDQGSGTGFPR